MQIWSQRGAFAHRAFRAFCHLQFLWVTSMNPAQTWSCGRREQQCCRAMKSMLPSWEDGAWTNTMPSISKVVSGWIKFPEPGHRCGLVSCPSYPADKNSHSDSTGSDVTHRSEGVVIECSLGTCSVLVPARLRDSGLKDRQHLHSGHLGNFHAVSWTSPSPREVRTLWGVEQEPLTQLLGSTRHLFGENFWSES